MSIDHEQARMLAGARADGEPADVAALEAHLSQCEACAKFAESLPRLGALARALPEEPLPEGFAFRPGGSRPKRSSWRPKLGATLAAAAVAIALLVGSLPIPTFRVTPAAAASALLTIRTLDVTREIREIGLDGRTTITTERIRFRAPASTRIDRTITGTGRLPVRETEIRVPGARALIRGETATLRTDLPPDPNPIPEPLSPALALAGRPSGPGPEIAGRPTQRLLLEGADGRVVREAFVDAEQASVLGSQVAVVLRKSSMATDRSRITKRVSSIAYNVPLEESLFALPQAAATSGGFRARPVPALSRPPAASPAGFRVVRSGSGPSGDAVLYARGAYTILVQIGPHPPAAEDAVIEMPADAGDGEASYLIGLYELPALRLRSDGVAITISAPMSRAELERLAARMFPA